MKFRKTLLIGVLSVATLTSCGSQANTFSITFHQDEGNKNDVFQVTEGKTTVEEVKAFQSKITINPRTGYDVTWEDYDFSKIKANYTVNALYNLHSYVITYKHGDETLGAVEYTVKSTDEEVKAKEPMLPTKAGYTYKYEDYTVVNKHEDFIVKTVESINEYTITYKDGSSVLGTTKFTVNSTDEEIKAKEPKIPYVAGYTKQYEDYTVVGKTADFTVNVKSSLITYHAKFYDKEGAEKQLIKDVEFNVESTSIDAPEVPAKEHYDGVWGPYSIKPQDQDVYPIYTAHTYHATFNFPEGEPTVKDFSIESTSVTTPDYTAPEHYSDPKWVSGDISVSVGDIIDLKDDLKDITFSLALTGEKHTITLNVNGGTMTESTSVNVEYGKEYTLPTPTFKSDAKFLGWFNSSGKQVATTGTSAFIEDETLYARYGIDFEKANNKDLVINGTWSTIGSKELDSKTCTEGSQSLKIVTTNATFRASLDNDFLVSAFADPSVKALNFDCKTEVECTKFSYANSVSAPYEYDCCSNNQPGFGGQTTWKTFSLTREMYNNYVKNFKASNNALFCTVGGQLPVDKAIWIDNIRPSSTAVNLLGFEGSRMVPKDDSSSHYKKSVSFRDFNNAELFCITTGYTDAINFGFDYEYKSEGLISIHYEHKANSNVWLTLPQLDMENVKEVSFDICLSKKYNGNTVRDGKGNELFPSTTLVDAYEWKTFTVTAEQISDAKQFCTVTSSVECDFWVDNIKIVLNS